MNQEKQSSLGEETMCIKREENELTNQKTDEVITDMPTCLRRKQIDERILNTGLLNFSYKENSRHQKSSDRYIIEEN